MTELFRGGKKQESGCIQSTGEKFRKKIEVESSNFRMELISIFFQTKQSVLI